MVSDVLMNLPRLCGCYKVLTGRFTLSLYFLAISYTWPGMCSFSCLVRSIRRGAWFVTMLDVGLMAIAFVGLLG